MKKAKITYWTSTTLISLMMLMSASMYFTSPDVKAGFEHLGYPYYFRLELAIAKILGVLALLLPMIKGRFKEWAYFGFFVTFVSALIAHLTVGDPAAKWSGAVVAIVLLFISYFSYQKLETAKA
jgi:uncharacterized membrane protein